MAIEQEYVKIRATDPDGTTANLTQLCRSITWSGDYRNAARTLSYSPVVSADDMAVAKERAQIYVWPIFMASMGWRDLKPGEYDEAIMLAMPEREKAAADSWEAFERWRVEQRKAGRKLDSIYRKDSIGINPIREAVVSQYREFLIGQQAQFEPMPQKTIQQPPELSQVPQQRWSVSPDVVRRQEAQRKAREERVKANQAKIDMAMEVAIAVGRSATHRKDRQRELGG